MNKRDFLTTLVKAAIGFTILPSAVTYTRKWKKLDTNLWIPNPAYVNAEYEVSFMVDTQFYTKFWQSYLEYTGSVDPIIRPRLNSCV